MASVRVRRDDIFIYVLGFRFCSLVPNFAHWKYLQTLNGRVTFDGEVRLFKIGKHYVISGMKQRRSSEKQEPSGQYFHNY